MTEPAGQDAPARDEAELDRLLILAREGADGNSLRTGLTEVIHKLRHERAVAAEVAHAVAASAAEQDAIIRRLTDEFNATRQREIRLMLTAQQVMTTLQAHGPGIVEHLLDTDSNPGQRLREAIEASRAGATTGYGDIAVAVQRRISADLLAEMLAINTRYQGTTEAAMGYLDGLRRALRLVSAALTRMAPDSGVRRRLADVAAEFGVDLDGGQLQLGVIDLGPMFG